MTKQTQNPKKDFADMWIDAIEKMGKMEIGDCSEINDKSSIKQLQTGYIITDDDLNIIDSMNQNEFVIDLLKRIRSSPLSDYRNRVTTIPTNCPYFTAKIPSMVCAKLQEGSFIRHCEKSAYENGRKTVLDELAKEIMKRTGIDKPLPFNPDNNFIPTLGVDELSDIINLLRGKEES